MPVIVSKLLVMVVTPVPGGVKTDSKVKVPSHIHVFSCIGTNEIAFIKRLSRCSYQWLHLIEINVLRIGCCCINNRCYKNEDLPQSLEY